MSNVTQDAAGALASVADRIDELNTSVAVVQEMFPAWADRVDDRVGELFASLEEVAGAFERVAGAAEGGMQDDPSAPLHVLAAEIDAQAERVRAFVDEAQRQLDSFAQPLRESLTHMDAEAARIAEAAGEHAAKLETLLARIDAAAEALADAIEELLDHCDDTLTSDVIEELEEQAAEISAQATSVAKEIADNEVPDQLERHANVLLADLTHITDTIVDAFLQCLDGAKRELIEQGRQESGTRATIRMVMDQARPFEQLIEAELGRLRDLGAPVGMSFG